MVGAAVKQFSAAFLFMDYYAKHADGFKQVEDKLDTSCPVFAWANSEWKIIPGSAHFKKPLDIGGFTMNCDLQFWVLLSQFNQTGSQLKEAMQDTSMGYQGDDFKIIGVSVAPGGLQAIIEANALNQRA